MALTKRAGKPPRAIAEGLVLALAGNDVVAAAEVAGPGFVNLRLRPRVFQDVIAEILRAGQRLGSGARGDRRAHRTSSSSAPTRPGR